MIIAIAAAALGGLILGSLLNVVAHRLAHGESLTSPGPRCPGCRRPIRARDNVPVVSWLLLKGRCRDCGEPIARRYPLVEVGTAATLAAVVAARHGDAAQLTLGLVLVAVLVPLALIDLDTRRLPNRITLPAGLAAIALGTILDASGEPERLLAGVAAGAFFLLVAVAYPQGMGIGDVKLAAVLGLFLGRDVAAALLVALVAGVLVGALIVARKGMAEGRKTGVPFGPFLALGAIVALLAGGALVDAYVGTF